MNNTNKLVGILLGITMLASITAATLSNNIISSVHADRDYTVCGAYKTNEDWNISYDEVLSLTNFEAATQNFNYTSFKACSEIISSVEVVSGQFYRQETGKEEVKSLKFGTGSVKGSLTLILTKNIDAIGFYADAYQHSKDQASKTLAVNGQTTKVLGHSYTYNLSNDVQRFFIEFDTPTNEVTIEASAAANNRFHLYSIGFYSKSNFPDADSGGGDIPVDPPVETTVTILPADGTAVTSSDYSIEKDSVTVSVKASTLTAEQIRVFKGKTLNISSTNYIKGIQFTCTTEGSAQYGPGCFSVNIGTYDYEGTIGTWTGSANSVTFTASTNQVRITQIIITF